MHAFTDFCLVLVILEVILLQRADNVCHQELCSLYACARLYRWMPDQAPGEREPWPPKVPPVILRSQSDKALKQNPDTVSLCPHQQSSQQWSILYGNQKPVVHLRTPGHGTLLFPFTQPSSPLSGYRLSGQKSSRKEARLRNWWR